MSVNGHGNSICDTVLGSNDTSGHKGMNDVDTELTTLINNVHQELKQYGNSVTLQELQTLISRLRDLKNLMLVQSNVRLQVHM